MKLFVKSLRPWLAGQAIILLAAAMAVAPQLVHGNSCGHDFNFHLASWFDCLNSWRHGILYPHWAPSANFGAGEPRFVFYSPLTWMLAPALALALPWPVVPIALTFLLLAGTGLATRALARQALPEGAATLAGCVALFSGYALFTAYERTAFAELAGGLWIPLVFLFALRGLNIAAPSLPQTVWRRALDGSVVPLAVAVGGAWLSNPTVGVMACYLLAAVALTVTLLSRSWAFLLRASAGAALGIGLVAIYLVPAAWEQRWVDIHQVTSDPGQTLENNWLFAVHADPALALHDQVLHTVSIIAICMIAAALVGLLASWLRGSLPGKRLWWVPLALTPVAVLFLLFPISHWLWNLLPDLRFLQFPWRWLLVLEAPMAVFVVAAVWPRQSAGLWRRVVVVTAVIALCLWMTALASGYFFQSCDEEDAVPSMLDRYRSGQGFNGTGEYEPIGADNSLIATGLPDACLVSDPATELGVVPDGVQDDDAIPAWSTAQGSCGATMRWQVNQPEHRVLRGVVSQAGFLILRLRSYPAWRIAVNGMPVASMPRRGDGLMAVPVPKGRVDLTVDWTTTPDVIAGRWLSALAVLLLTGLWFLERKLDRPRLS
jgi:hypothetical protein